MTSRIIEITVSPNGQTTVETQGFVGPVCRDASRFLERALGKPTNETLKAEFHQQASSENQIHQGE
ncbi:DUF2997 domain-containing protein [Thalassoroseus pseudoceratinae]|uniref:DUF2997 domain-containing protein n=1 Tax=Thalassoroseus pseudoceratinae TaxID=2713176 RepID=UPI00142251C6|nr:DUF2997 domain-containing protein [Thalassoroseus pseudoceratinae]